MWRKTLLFTGGVLLFQQMPVLPSVYWVLILPVFALFVRRQPYALYITFLLSGFCWSLIVAQYQLSERISTELLATEIRITGTVSDIPQQLGHDNWRFDFSVERAFQGATAVKLPRHIRLGWYHSKQQIKAGQVWHLSVKLKPPTGHHNPGSFNYETWLYQQGVGARGYVLERVGNRKIADAAWYASINSLRQQISDSLAGFSRFPQAAAVSRALVVGDKSAISQESWSVFRNTGSNHLVAISGLHIGLVAALFYTVCGFCWRRSAYLCRLLPAQKAQASGALLAAAGYAALAGFSVPTQRALIMLAVILGAVLLNQPLRPNRHLALALFLVLLLDPLAVLSAGFWLSFLAVGAIALMLSGRLHISAWSSAAKVQLAISLLLLPVLVLWFGQFSLLAPLVNLLLVPLFAFWIVPASLLLTLLVLTGWPVFDDLMNLQLAALDWLLQLLGSVADLPFASVSVTTPALVSLFLLCLGVILLLLPKGFTGRWSGVLLLPVIFVPFDKPLEQALQMTVLDVGQGLCVLIRSGRHTLLYDLGPAYSSGYDATRSLVVPVLKSRGIRHIDKLIISHADSDHAGNPAAILDEFSVGEVLSGEALHRKYKTQRCMAGQSWQWSGTRLEFLSPASGSHAEGNNSSCVLRITQADSSILLTGDIEQTVEQQLLEQSYDKLKALIVVVPHHGSRTSSSPAFVRAVNARYVLNSSGYLNRYDFPRQQVVARWRDNNAVFYDTAAEGAIELTLDSRGHIHQIRRSRTDALKYWYWDRQFP